MRRKSLEPIVSLVLLVASALAFAAGLVLLTRFHMGHGSLGSAALGLSRLGWLDLHRVAALVAVTALAGHLTLDWRGLVGWVRGAFRPKRARGAVLELLLYAAFGTVAITGLAAWWLVDGSTPFLGPVPLGRLPHARHELVDVHDLSGLIALVFVVHHVGHRWQRLQRALLRRGAPAERPA